MAVIQRENQFTQSQLQGTVSKSHCRPVAEAEGIARNLSFNDPFGGITSLSVFLECAQAIAWFVGFTYSCTKSHADLVFFNSDKTLGWIR